MLLMADGAKVDDTALITNGSPSLLQVILIHAAKGNIAVTKGVKMHYARCEGTQVPGELWLVMIISLESFLGWQSDPKLDLGWQSDPNFVLSFNMFLHRSIRTKL